MKKKKKKRGKGFVIFCLGTGKGKQEKPRGISKRKKPNIEKKKKKTKISILTAEIRLNDLANVNGKTRKIRFGVEISQGNGGLSRSRGGGSKRRMARKKTKGRGVRPSMVKTIEYE